MGRTTESEARFQPAIFRAAQPVQDRSEVMRGWAQMERGFRTVLREVGRAVLCTPWFTRRPTLGRRFQPQISTDLEPPNENILSLVLLVPLVGYHLRALLCYGFAGMTKNHAKDRVRFGAANSRRSETHAERHGPPGQSHRAVLNPAHSRDRPRSSGPAALLQAFAGVFQNGKAFSLLGNEPTNPTKPDLAQHRE